MTDAYPANREADVVLRDGSTVHLRPVRPDDVESLFVFFRNLDLRSQSLRFFSGAPDLEGTAELMAQVDYRSRYGIVASRGGREDAIGHGVYAETHPGQAEIAFAVASEMQGRGLGTIILAHLAEVAEENGFSEFVAEVLPQNHRMIEMFRRSGFPVEVEARAEGVHVVLPTAIGDGAAAGFEDRDRIAAAAAARTFLEPASVCVIGASRRPGRVGSAVLANLLASGFDGEIFAVNRSGDGLGDVAAAGTVAELPSGFELGVIAVPAADVVGVARECAARGARSLVVLSAGFAEAGGSGLARERELRDVCRAAGMRLVGPNCLGVLNMSPEHRLNATFAPSPPPAGDVGFVTQSGALGLALIDLAAAKGIGVSSFASVGNRADVTANDLLEYWEGDPATRVALLYIESFSDPRRFSRISRRIGRELPIVVVKSGRSAAGARAASSHTGALLAASDIAADALFEQSGVIRAETMSELLDVASLLSSQPLPQGKRVGVLTNAGGPGIMCADACEAAGLSVPELPEELRERLRKFLPGEAALSNPVDMIATADGEQYRRAIAELAGWEGIDALIVIFIRPLLTEAADVATAVREAAAQLPREIPIQAVFMSPADHAAVRETAAVPTHLYPEDAARALARVVRHAEWRARPLPVPAPDPPGCRTDEAAAVLAEALAQGREWLAPEQVAALLDCYGIVTPAGRRAGDAEEAVAAAAELGRPVALKAVGPEILHKSELGAVRLDLADPEAVAEAAAAIEAALASHGVAREAFLVEPMVGGEVEVLVGIATDPVFGPVLAVGAGGTLAELRHDIGVRVCPLSAGDPDALLSSLAMSPLLHGYRGSEPVDVAALEDLILAVGAIAENHSSVAELDLNPVLAGPEGAVAVDARVRVQDPVPPRPWPRTWI
ncbi:MAG: GNAT family N-acetyltransferase [Solirubrobacterales bacterium]